MSKARDIKSALGSSMRAEEVRVADRRLDRFARAEAVLQAATSGDPESDSQPEEQKVIRDSFSLPANDYGLFDSLRQRALKCGVHATKSELVRSGLRILDSMNDSEFVDALHRVEKLKTGRPRQRSSHTVITV